MSHLTTPQTFDWWMVHAPRRGCGDARSWWKVHETLHARGVEIKKKNHPHVVLNIYLYESPTTPFFCAQNFSRWKLKWLFRGGHLPPSLSARNATGGGKYWGCRSGKGVAMKEHLNDLIIMYSLCEFWMSSLFRYVDVTCERDAPYSWGSMGVFSPKTVTSSFCSSSLHHHHTFSVCLTSLNTPCLGACFWHFFLKQMPYTSSTIAHTYILAFISWGGQRISWHFLGIRRGWADDELGLPGIWE